MAWQVFHHVVFNKPQWSHFIFSIVLSSSRVDCLTLAPFGLHFKFMGANITWLFANIIYQFQHMHAWCVLKFISCLLVARMNDFYVLCCIGLGYHGYMPVGGGMHVLRSWSPFSQASRRSLAYQYTIHAPLMCPHFQFLEKNAFTAMFLAQISALKTEISTIFVSKTLLFSMKVRSLDLIL